jgi:hypothetical protein
MKKKKKKKLHVQDEMEAKGNNREEWTSVLKQCKVLRGL